MENEVPVADAGKPTVSLKARLKFQLNNRWRPSLPDGYQALKLPASEQHPPEEFHSSQLGLSQPDPCQSQDARQAFVCVGCGRSEISADNLSPESPFRCSICQLRSPFLNLPAELQLEIARYLDPVTVVALKLCNKLLYGRISVPISRGGKEFNLLRPIHLLELALMNQCDG